MSAVPASLLPSPPHSFRASTSDHHQVPYNLLEMMQKYYPLKQRGREKTVAQEVDGAKNQPERDAEHASAVVVESSDDGSLSDSDSESDSEPSDDSSADSSDGHVANLTPAISSDVVEMVSSSTSLLITTRSVSPHGFINEVQPLISISHAGTRGRKRGSALHPDNGTVNKRSRLLAPNRNTSPVPKRTLTVPVTPSAGVNRCPAPRSPPQGPKAATERSGICFFWYHQGYCKPRCGKDGNTLVCKFLHKMEPGEKLRLESLISWWTVSSDADDTSQAFAEF
ncbi:hypothetical protein N0V90_005610 [Kalmusia sp. IMI 367209]|nr:hypothetical protein N0V90_005610 [Kalmusia sp. IMI 367209]